VSVTVCGVAIGREATKGGTNHVASYDVGAGLKMGMAVTAYGSMMARTSFAASTQSL
jgi:hypothetical protein